MNIYISGRVDDFRSYYNSLSKEKQIGILRDYFGQDIKHKVFGVLSGRKYCEYLAQLLIEKQEIKVGILTFEELVDEIENYLSTKKNKLYPKWQRDLLAFSLKKSRFKNTK